MRGDPDIMLATEADYEVETMAPWRGAWRSMDCAGCGQRPDDMTALDAIALTTLLGRRCESLLAHPEDSLHQRGPKPGSWSALEPATQVSAVLAVADSRLRDLLGEEPVPDVPTAIATPGSAAALLMDGIRRLIATMRGATTYDWYRPRSDNGATAREVVWLALHQATHHIEDAELVLDAALATNARSHGQPGELPTRLTLL